MERERAEISEAERDVLAALWDGGPATVREVQERLGTTRWSRSTVITLLQRLEKKGYVVSDRGGFAFVFRAIVSREELVERRMEKLADDLYEGQAAPLLLAFARRRRFTAEEIAEFRALIDELDERGGESERTPRKPKGGPP
jgi:predicted transcriptional regulator